MTPGDKVQIINTDMHGEAFHEGQAELVEQVYQLWWMVRFWDGCIEKRRIEPDAQADPAAFVAEFNRNRSKTHVPA